MRVLNLSGIRHAVVVAPHSDDETIAAFFTIAALRRLGARVDIVIVTDGSASHRNSKLYPTDKLVSLRETETLSAMQLAGVHRDRVTFLGLPDGGLRDLSEADLGCIVRRLKGRPCPDLLIVPSNLDDHPDHRSVASWCDRAWPPAIARLRYLVWPSPGIASRPRYRIIGGQGDPTVKRTALRRYQSQLGLIRDDPTGFSLTPDMIDRMCRPCERFIC